MPRVPEEQLHLRFAPSSFSSEDSLQERSDSPSEAQQSGATILPFHRRDSLDANVSDERSTRFALIQKVLDRVSKF
jgi:hypothetical protein